ncbi:MAG: histidine ammonia-lyase [Planctomycetota bacterium]|nr:histidine ammonia-lyase [Planctomycetota bacterium]
MARSSDSNKSAAAQARSGKSRRVVRLDGCSFKLRDLAAIAAGEATLRLTRKARQQIQAASRSVEAAAASSEPIYGINTGFGRFCRIQIEPSEVKKLQLNLIRSHATGIGTPLEPSQVRLALALRANALARGNSGIDVEVIELLMAMLEKDVLPKIPRMGSVGASGDLAPLSHLALVLVGEGEARVGGRWVSGKTALRRNGLEPIVLKAKEGLSLINGVQVSVAMLAGALLEAQAVVDAADLSAAISLEGLLGSMQPFDARIHQVRPHPGQARVAASIRALLKGSQISASHINCDRVQDPYSLRCVPQVHGAVRDAMDWIGQTIEREANSSTDNPLVFSEQNEVLSGGNFHGAPVAYAADLLSIVLADLSSISERRTEKLINPDTNQGLPAFLARNEGLESGWMMAQVTAASLVSRMKVLSHPASVDSIVTSAGSEDHVSMSTHAAEKAAECAGLAAHVIGIELLVALDAIELRRPLRSGRRLEQRIAAIRKRIPARSGDRILAYELEDAAALVREGQVAVL